MTSLRCRKARWQGMISTCRQRNAMTAPRTVPRIKLGQRRPTAQGSESERRACTEGSRRRCRARVKFSIRTPCNKGRTCSWHASERTSPILQAERSISLKPVLGQSGFRQRIFPSRSSLTAGSSRLTHAPPWLRLGMEPEMWSSDQHSIYSTGRVSRYGSLRAISAGPFQQVVFNGIQMGQTNG
jgi:hypothetical protein